MNKLSLILLMMLASSALNAMQEENMPQWKDLPLKLKYRLADRLVSSGKMSLEELAATDKDLAEYAKERIRHAAE